PSRVATSSPVVQVHALLACWMVLTVDSCVGALQWRRNPQLSAASPPGALVSRLQRRGLGERLGAVASEVAGLSAAEALALAGKAVEVLPTQVAHTVPCREAPGATTSSITRSMLHHLNSLAVFTVLRRLILLHRGDIHAVVRSSRCCCSSVAVPLVSSPAI